MSAENRVTMEPELRTMLGRHREELLRRALALAISRSTLDELVERPLGERLDELELLFEAASPEGGGESGARRRNRDLRSELDHQLAEHRARGPHLLGRRDRRRPRRASRGSARAPRTAARRPGRARLGERAARVRRPARTS